MVETNETKETGEYVSMRKLLEKHVPLRHQGEVVAQIRKLYNEGDATGGAYTIGQLCERFDLSRPTVRKVLDDADINCPYPPVVVRSPGRRAS